MWLPSAEALAALKGGHQRTWRMMRLQPETLDPLEVYEHSESVLIKTTISAVRKRLNRYTVTGSIMNRLGALPWTRPGDPFYPETVWRIDAGVRLLSRAWEWIPQVTGLLRDPDGDGGRLAFSLADLMRAGERSGFTVPDTCPRGTRAGRAIMDLLIASGMGDDPTLYDFDDGGRVVDSDLPYEPGEYRLEKAFWIAQHLGLELYSGRTGRRTLRPMVTILPAPSWDCVRGPSSTYATARRKVGIDDLYNHTHVKGVVAGLPEVEAESRDLNPLSPTYNPFPPARGTFGDRLYPMEVSSIIGDVATCKARSDALLLEVALVTEDIQIEAVPTLVLDPGDVVRVTDERIDASALDSWLDEVVTGTTLGETQSLRSRQVRSLLAA